MAPPPHPPIEPPPSRVAFPDPRGLGDSELVAIGADWSPGTFVAAFRRGIFPWPMSSAVVPWVSPVERAIFPLEDEPRWSRSLARKLRQHDYEVTLDEAFDDVVDACGGERADGTWIVPEMRGLYGELHRRGFAHSLEVWSVGERKALVGGIFGIAVGAAFSGESMFHRRTDASKLAFAEMVARLRSGGFRLFDVQILSSHLASLGCVAIPREEYLERLSRALPLAARLG